MLVVLVVLSVLSSLLKSVYLQPLLSYVDSVILFVVFRHEKSIQKKLLEVILHNLTTISRSTQSLKPYA